MTYRQIIPKTITIAFLLLIAPSLQAIEWYNSNPGGNMGSPLNEEGGKASLGWTLSIEHEIITLEPESQGTETHDTNTPKPTRSREQRTLYRGNQKQTTEILLRQNGYLISWEILDAEGNQLSITEYAWDVIGKPQASYITTDTNGSPEMYTETWTNTQADSNVFRQSYGIQDHWLITDMDTTWQPIKEISYESEEPSSKTTWLRTEDGQLLESIEEHGEITVSRKYNQAGLLVQEQKMRGNVMLQTHIYTWDNNQLIREESQGEGKYTVREIEWNEDKISLEVYYEGGIKEKQISWPSPREKIETLYKNGNALIRIYWLDGKRQKEEFLHKGIVVRTKEFKK